MYISRRSPVYGTHGMVASSQNYASEAGFSVLKDGGNAIDAAIAMAAVLAVTEPSSTGLGGDCFMLVYLSSTNSVQCMNGSGSAPHALTVEAIRTKLGLEPHTQTDTPSSSHPEIPVLSALAVTVPGAVKGWEDAYERFSAKKHTFADLMAPAIHLAKHGFGVGTITANEWKKWSPQLINSANSNELLMPDGTTPKPGDRFFRPTLANSLETIARLGSAGFYSGEIAERIVEEVQQHGGLLTCQDLANHTTSWVEPISVVYKGIRVFEAPPNGQGLTVLLALNILTALDLQWADIPWGSVLHIHTLIEVMRLAFADARRYIADPEHTRVPVTELLSIEYARTRAQLFNQNLSNTSISNGYPERDGGTVSFQSVDLEGNAVSFVFSHFMGFGTGLIPRGCGFTLQNRGRGFSLNPAHPNVVAPDKRPYHTIIPCICMREGGEGGLYCTLTNMGGFMQPQGHVQLLINMLEYDMDPQTAIDAPRFCIASGTAGGEVRLEPGLAGIAQTLTDMQHNICLVEGFDRDVMGRAQIIRKEPNGLWCAGSDGRGDGQAIGW